jgi:hypothetical protein
MIESCIVKGMNKIRLDIYFLVYRFDIVNVESIISSPFIDSFTTPIINFLLLDDYKLECDSDNNDTICILYHCYNAQVFMNGITGLRYILNNLL